MKTVVISIGNSDNRLSQTQWSEFVQETDKTIAELCSQKHFFGGPCTWTPWQNTAWIADCNDDCLPALKYALTSIRFKYGQIAAAYMEGEMEFI